MTKALWAEWFKANEEWFLSVYDSPRQIRKKFTENDDIMIANGCSKVCIVDKDADFVLKWTIGSNTTFNEMQREFAYYEEAKTLGLTQFFPKTELFIQCGDITIYAQEKISIAHCDLSYGQRETMNKKYSTVKGRTLKKATASFYTRPPVDWVRAAIAIYGKKQVKRLTEFTREKKINDLHSANVGYRGSYPVILDFSGFHRDSEDCYSSSSSC